MHWHGLFQFQANGFAPGAQLLHLGAAMAGTGKQHFPECKWILHPDAAMAKRTLILVKQALGRCVVQVDIMLVREHVLHRTESVFPSSLLAELIPEPAFADRIPVDRCRINPAAILVNIDPAARQCRCILAQLG